MMLPWRIALTLAQVVLLAGLAPLLDNLIKTVKARLQRRSGPPLLQGYRDLRKLLIKESIHARPTSAIFRLAPAVSLTTSLAAAATFPVLASAALAAPGDVLTALYVLALGRFFTALAGLDAASAFGGLGSSRDVSLAALVEPVAVVAILVLAAGMVTPSDGAALAGAGADLLAPWRLLAAIAFFMVILAECARVPIDNPATHLELTMIHEAMLLEYSGRELACATLAARIKQTVLLAMLATIFFPIGLGGAAAPTAAGVGLALLALLGKLAILAILIGVVESVVAKLRLFRVPDFLGGAFGIALLAYIAREAL